MRDIIDLACTVCKQRNYTTRKNKKNDPDRLERNKFCKFCRKHIAYISDVLPAELTELVPLQSIRIVLLVLAGRIISLLTDRTGQIDNISHLPSPEPSTLSHQP